MTAQERVYPCDRILMLNAVGDIIDGHRGKILLSDTENGRLDAQLKNRDNQVIYRFRIFPENGVCRLRIETGSYDTPTEKLARESRQIETLFFTLDELLIDALGAGETPGGFHS